MNSSSVIHVLAIIRFQSAHAAAVSAAMTQHAINSRSEAGCLRYEVFLQNDAPVIVTQESWADREAEKAHMAGPHVAALVARIGAFLSAAPEITYHSQIA